MYYMGNNLQHDETAPDFYTLAEVGQRLRLSRTTLWRMQKRGELPVQHFGSSVRVPRAWVEQMSEAQSA